VRDTVKVTINQGFQ